MGSSKVKIEGGMSPTFISQIARSSGVNKKVESSYQSVKKKLEAKASARDPLEGRRIGKYHYGSASRRGSWGTTWIMWAITNTARSNTTWVRAAISSAKNIVRKR